MRIVGRLLTGLVLAAGLLPAADPGLLNLVMPDAKALAGLQAGQMKSSPMMQYMLRQADAATDANLRKFVDATGFDPLQDVTEVLVASTMTTGAKNQEALLLARGNFNTGRILEAARTAGATLSKYNGVDYLVPKSRAGNKAMALAFLDQSLAVAGTPALVKAAIDRRNQVAGLSPAILNRVQEYSSQNDIWFYSTVPADAFQKAAPAVPGVAPGAAPQQAQAMLQMFSAITEAGGGVKLGNDIRFTLQALTKTAADATAITDVMRFGLTMLQSQLAQQPNADKSFLELTKNIQISATASTALVSFSIPQATIEKMIEDSKKKATQPSVVRPAELQGKPVINNLRR